MSFKVILDRNFFHTGQQQKIHLTYPYPGTYATVSQPWLQGPLEQKRLGFIVCLSSELGAPTSCEGGEQRVYSFPREVEKITLITTGFFSSLNTKGAPTSPIRFLRLDLELQGPLLDSFRPTGEEDVEVHISFLHPPLEASGGKCKSTPLLSATSTFSTVSFKEGENPSQSEEIQWMSPTNPSSFPQNACSPHFPDQDIPRLAAEVSQLAQTHLPAPAHRAPRRSPLSPRTPSSSSAAAAAAPAPSLDRPRRPPVPILLPINPLFSQQFEDIEWEGPKPDAPEREQLQHLPAPAAAAHPGLEKNPPELTRPRPVIKEISREKFYEVLYIMASAPPERSFTAPLSFIQLALIYTKKKVAAGEHKIFFQGGWRINRADGKKIDFQAALPFCVGRKEDGTWLVQHATTKTNVAPLPDLARITKGV